MGGRGGRGGKIEALKRKRDAVGLAIKIPFHYVVDGDFLHDGLAPRRVARAAGGVASLGRAFGALARLGAFLFLDKVKKKKVRKMARQGRCPETVVVVVFKVIGVLTMVVMLTMAMTTTTTITMFLLIVGVVVQIIMMHVDDGDDDDDDDGDDYDYDGGGYGRANDWCWWWWWRWWW